MSAASGEDQEETKGLSESIPRASDDQNLDLAEIVSGANMLASDLKYLTTYTWN